MMDGIDQRHGHVSSNEILRLGFSSNFKQELQYHDFIGASPGPDTNKTTSYQHQVWRRGAAQAAAIRELGRGHDEYLRP